MKNISLEILIIGYGYVIEFDAALQNAGYRVR